MGSIWFSLLSLTAGWLFLLTEYEPSSPVVAAVMFAIGVALAAHWLRRSETAGSGQTLTVTLGATALAAVLLPLPYGLGPLLMASGCALLLTDDRMPEDRRGSGAAARIAAQVGRGALLAGAILATQAAAIVAYLAGASRSHEAMFVGRLGALLMRAVGASAATASEGLVTHSGIQTLAFSFTWERFGALSLVLFIAGALPVIAFASTRRFALPLLIGITFIFAEVRFALFVLMTTVSGRLDLFWSRAMGALSLIPLVLLFMTVLPAIPPSRLIPAGAPLESRRFKASALLALLAAAALVGATSFEEPGIHKAGRVIIEEGKSDWEWTTEKFDTEWYGEKSGYNYFSLYHYLDHHYRMSRNTGAITPELLARADVFILKVPTSALTAEEIDNLVAFVHDGGGLLLIGDHTNVFGTSTNINPVAERFGMHFNHDATYTLQAGELTEYRAPERLSHPIVQHLPGPFLFGTSASMQIAPTARAVIVDDGLKALDADYSQDNFFPASDWSTEMRFGSFVQGATVRYGRGRVDAYADSTVFSNFWIFVPGKPELALSYVDWLNRENGIPYARALLGLAAVTAAAAGTLAGRTMPPKTLALALAAGLVAGLGVGTTVWTQVNRMAYPLPRPHTDYVSVRFEREYSRFAIPDTLVGFAAEPDENLHTFYVWVQRLGYMPSIPRSFDEAVEGGDVVVLVNPAGGATPEDVARLTSYVKAGGRVLIVDSAANTGSSAGLFLEPFGMALGSAATGSLQTDSSDRAQPLGLTDAARTVTGGVPLLTSDSGDVVCAYARSGDGTIAVFSDSALFFNSHLGTTGMVPGPAQGDIAAIEFGLLRFLAEDIPLAF